MHFFRARLKIGDFKYGNHLHDSYCNQRNKYFQGEDRVKKSTSDCDQSNTGVVFTDSQVRNSTYCNTCTFKTC